MKGKGGNLVGYKIFKAKKLYTADNIQHELEVYA